MVERDGAHATGTDAAGLLSPKALEAYGGCENWEARLRDPVGAQTLVRLREATNSGRPFAESTFVEELERRLGRSLRPGSPGRPRKTRSAAAGKR